MKKYISVFAIMLMIFLAACSNQNTSSTPTSNENNTQSNSVTKLDEGVWPANEYTEGLPVALRGLVRHPALGAEEPLAVFGAAVSGSPGHRFLYVSHPGLYCLPAHCRADLQGIEVREGRPFPSDRRAGHPVFCLPVHCCHPDRPHGHHDGTLPV